MGHSNCKLPTLTWGPGGGEWSGGLLVGKEEFDLPLSPADGYFAPDALRQAVAAEAVRAIMDYDPRTPDLRGAAQRATGLGWAPVQLAMIAAAGVDRA